MPLFKSRRESESTGSDVSDTAATTSPAPNNDPGRKVSIFSSRRNETNPTAATANGGTAGRNPDDTASTHSRSIFRGRGSAPVDPKVLAAKEKVKFAEEREKAADEALVAARNAVVEAREHARRLEEEAAEE